jgi:hypothetical protein
MWRAEERHDFDVISLVMGLMLLGVAIAALVVADFHVRWILPGMLIALGAAGLAGSLRGNGTPTTASEPEDPAQSR